MEKKLMLSWLRIVNWLAKRSPWLAKRWGIVGVAAYIIPDGPNKGLFMGIAFVMDEIRAEKQK